MKQLSYAAENAVRLVLADDHPFLLQGLRMILDREPDFEVVAGCQDGDEALRAIREFSPHVAVLDLNMPVRHGMDVLQELKDSDLPTRPVILAAGLSEREALDALRLGARGIVLKEMAPQFLVKCIRVVSQGGEWFEREIAARALNSAMRRAVDVNGNGSLTERERDVVRMVAEGLRNKEIARKLNITEGTVKMHLHNIFTKAGVSNRVALARYAQEKQIA